MSMTHCKGSSGLMENRNFATFQHWIDQGVFRVQTAQS